MTDQGRRIDEVPKVTTLANTDYIVCISQADTANAQTALISVSDLKTVLGE